MKIFITNQNRRNSVFLKHRLYGQTLNKHSDIDVRTFKNQFGTWRNAIEKSGLSLLKGTGRYNEDQLFQNLMKVWEYFGRRPKYREMFNSPSEISGTTYDYRFGSWKKALGDFLKWVKTNSNDTENIPDPIPEKQKLKQNEKKIISRLSDGMRDKRRTATPKQRWIVLNRDGFRCLKDGLTPSDGIKLEVDHIIPWSEGGRTIIENLRTLCNICNKGKSDTELEGQQS